MTNARTAPVAIVIIIDLTLLLYITAQKSRASRVDPAIPASMNCEVAVARKLSDSDTSPLPPVLINTNTAALQLKVDATTHAINLGMFSLKILRKSIAVVNPNNIPVA